MRARLPYSLQARLLVLVLGLAALVWLGAALLTWQDTRKELDELLDGHLAQAAALLVVQQSRAEEEGDDIEDAPSLHKYAPKVSFQVFHEDRLISRSANAGTQPMTSAGSGFDTVRLSDGDLWRVFVARGAHSDVRVYVGERIDARRSILWAVLRSMLWPLVIGLPLFALALWWSIRRGLAPLRQLSGEISQRPPQALEPVTQSGLPRELRPLVTSLNDLFARIGQMVASERRFTADAAHELRTPIAAIRAQAQVAIGATDDPAERLHALQLTLAGCDRATRLVEQLLMLARLEATATEPDSIIDLALQAQRVAADLAPAALAGGQTLELTAPANCFVRGNDTLAGVLLRNLADNALRYSPKGAHVRLQIELDAENAVLRVEDSGPGMTSEQMARLGERFYRVLGNDKPGSGLGYSIVQRIAAVFGARIEVGASLALGGLAVTVLWPLAPAARR
jgi:two-component system sensor histidine kinase QseC